MTMLDEKEIIKIFQKHFAKGYSDDVEFVRLNGSLHAIKVDSLVESTDIPAKMTAKEAARKSVVASISDFAAKGVKPLYGIVSVTFPKNFPKKKITSIARGLAKASKEFNFQILGGDTNEGKELSIQVFLLGIAKKIVSRKDAKVGDIIFTTGPFGYTSAGLKILLENKTGSKTFAQKAKRAVLLPDPRLKFGLDNSKYFSSSMDSSDGLSTTLHEMARQSKKKFIVTRIPANKELMTFAKTNRLNADDLVFNGGEEYEIVATASTKNFKKIKKYSYLKKIQLFEIGYVSKGTGVWLRSENKTQKIPDKGWVHFR